MKGLYYDNPLIFFIIYTIIVISVVWGITAFVLGDRKFNTSRSEVEQYKAKMQIMENDMNILREDNRRYLNWLQSMPNAAAYIEMKLKNLDRENPSSSNTMPLNKMAFKGAESSTKQLYTYTLENLHKGEAFIDPYTGVSLGIVDINSKFEADVIISIPGKEAREYTRVKTGMAWNYDYKESKFKIVIYKINWYNNTFGVLISQLG